MIFTIGRASSDRWNPDKPCDGAFAINISGQTLNQSRDAKLYLIDLDLEGLLSLSNKEKESVIVSSSIYEVAPGLSGGSLAWDVPVKAKTPEEQELLDKAQGSILIYDDYIE